MKRVILTICLAAAVFSVMGCDSKPRDFDHHTDGWELWREGTIERKKIIMVTRGGSTKKRVFSLEFINGEDVISTRFYKWENIEEGSMGFLYCWNGYDADNTYMWVPSGVAPITSSPKKKKNVTSEISTKNTQKNFIRIDPESFNIEKLSVKIYSWQGLITSPPLYQTVLVKFKNGLVSTAYITPTGDWKAELDRKKLSGGRALKNISQWKIVDLE